MYKQAQGWDMPCQHQSGMLRQPPKGWATDFRPRVLEERPRLPRSDSSSSSLRDCERPVSSFQEFSQRIPSVDPNKPLPSIPQLMHRRSNNSLIDLHCSRASSVYSQNPSGWRRSSERSWTTEDLADEPPLLLRSAIYRAGISSPDLNAYKAGCAAEEPRSFSSVISSPSPTSSTVTIQSMPSAGPLVTIKSQDILLIPSNFKRQPPTVSIDEAKLASRAAGKLPMLPEELRAAAFRKYQSEGQPRIDSLMMMSLGQKVATPIDKLGYSVTNGPALPVQSEGGGSLAEATSMLLRESRVSSLNNAAYRPAQNAFHVGTGPARDMAPPPAHDLEGSSDDENDRGRREHQSGKTLASGSKDNAREFAREYDSLLLEHRRDHSASSAESSDHSIRTHMKMIPQPLFQEKQSYSSTQTRATSSSEESRLPYNVYGRVGSIASTSSAEQTTSSSTRPTWDPSPSTRASNRSGVIPISPPADYDMKKTKPSLANTRSSVKGNAKQRVRDRIRDSDYYPHIVQRRQSSQKHGPSSTSSDLPVIGRPLLAADIIAQQLKTPESTPKTSPLAAEIKPTRNMPQRSDAGSATKSKKRLYQRLADGLKYRRRSSLQMTSSQSLNVGRSHDTPQRVAQSQDTFSPAVHTTVPVHLGWSNAAKHDFDEAQSPTILSPTPHTTQITQALEHGDESPEPPTWLARPSLFGDFSFFPGRKEDKNQKRREELKRMIRVVPRGEIVDDAD